MANSLEGEGAEEILIAIEDHREHLAESGFFQIRQEQRTLMEIQNRLELLIGAASNSALQSESGRLILSEVLNRNISPSEAAKSIASSTIRDFS